MNLIVYVDVIVNQEEIQIQSLKSLRKESRTERLDNLSLHVLTHAVQTLNTTTLVVS